MIRIFMYRYVFMYQCSSYSIGVNHLYNQIEQFIFNYTSQGIVES